MTTADIQLHLPERKKRETAQDRKRRILDANGHQCSYCGTSLRYKTRRCPFTGWDLICSGAYPQLDHDVPRSRGGLDNDENLVPSCGACNAQKGRKTGDEYRAWKVARGL